MGYEYYDYGYDTGTAVSTGLGAVFGIFAFIYIISKIILVAGRHLHAKHVIFCELGLAPITPSL